MKRIYLTLTLVFLTLVSFAQQNDNQDNKNDKKDDETMNTVFGTKKFSIGGYGGPIMQISELDGELAFFMGGGGAVIINHSFIFGGAGYGTTSKLNVNPERYAALGLDEGRNYKLDFGYGGVMTGFIIGWKKPIHLSATLLTAWGGIDIHEDDFNNNWGNNWQSNSSSSSVFILQPNVALEINLTKFMRVGLGANYRYISGLTLNGYQNDDFAGLGAQLSFKFGKF